MKKVILALLVVAGTVFQFCTGPKKIADTPKMNYAANIQPLITMHCSPCHIPPRGNKEPLNTYEVAKKNIDESIRRVQLNPSDKGFMPFKHPKLSDSTISVFVKWKEQGLLEN